MPFPNNTTTQSVEHALRCALESATRTTAWGEQPDPVAQDVLAFADMTILAHIAQSHGLGTSQSPFGAMPGGVGSIAVFAGNKVLRLGIGASHPRPTTSVVLPTLARGEAGAVRYEILPRLHTTGVSEAMLTRLSQQLHQDGYVWRDAGLDNIGISPNDPERAFVLDPGGVEALPDTVVPRSFAVTNDPKDMERSAQWLQQPVEALDVHHGWLSLALLRKQIDECQASYSTFPKEAARTAKIERLLRQGNPVQPVWVQKGDPSLFVIEGRHRMVALTRLGYTEIPVVYVGTKSPSVVPRPERKRFF